MTHHKLKTDPVMFRAARDGHKNFETRKDDRAFQTGDTVELTYHDTAAPTWGGVTPPPGSGTEDLSPIKRRIAWYNLHRCDVCFVLVATIMSDKIFDDAFNLLCGDKIAKWLAPCEYMSPDGRILLQRKVTPCEPEELERMPKALPAFLTDTKFKNFGWLDGRVVCIDYAGTIPNPSLKMVKAEWW